MRKAYQKQKKTTQPKSEINALVSRKINTINREQLSPVKNSNQTHMNLWNFNIEILQRFQSKTLRSILNAPWYINNHRIHEDLQMNEVLSQIKKWNTKLESHTNALAVNLLHNSGTTYRLKSYTVLSLQHTNDVTGHN
jgi:hypothetical protein